MELAVGFNREVADWVEANIEGCRPFHNPTSIGVVSDGELIAGVVYTNWEPNFGVIEMSAAAKSARWLSPKTLKAIFEYPFEQLGCQMVVLRVSENNSRMIRIAKRFGFESYTIPRLRGRNENEIIFTLTDDAWRSNGYRR